MNAVLIIALTNAVLATVMFAIVAAFKSRIRNPAVLHWLWILVLLKLLTPPLWSPRWALLPDFKRAGGLSADAAISRDTNRSGSFNPQLSRTVEKQPFNPVQPEGFLEHPAPDLVPEATHDRRLASRGATSVSPLLFVAVVWGRNRAVVGAINGGSAACSAACGSRRRPAGDPTDDGVAG